MRADYSLKSVSCCRCRSPLFGENEEILRLRQSMEDRLSAIADPVSCIHTKQTHRFNELNHSLLENAQC